MPKGIWELTVADVLALRCKIGFTPKDQLVHLARFLGKFIMVVENGTRVDYHNRKVNLGMEVQGSLDQLQYSARLGNYLVFVIFTPKPYTV